MRGIKSHKVEKIKTTGKCVAFDDTCFIFLLL